MDKKLTYLILDQNRIKIGESKHPEKRLLAYNTHNSNCKLIAYGSGVTEKHLHFLYKDKRIDKEWFDLDFNDVKNCLDLIKDDNFYFYYYGRRYGVSESVCIRNDVLLNKDTSITNMMLVLISMHYTHGNKMYFNQIDYGLVSMLLSLNEQTIKNILSKCVKLGYVERKNGYIYINEEIFCKKL